MDIDYPLEYRQYTPKDKSLLTIYDLCKLANVNCPLLTQWPIYVEKIKKEANDKSLPKSFRNLPSRTYSTEIENPLEILKMLAYSGFEWQAREIIRNYNNKSRSPKQLEMVNNLIALNRKQ
jgi:hypothetical protein